MAKYCAGAVLLIRILTTLTVDTVTWHGRLAVTEGGGQARGGKCPFALFVKVANFRVVFLSSL